MSGARPDEIHAFFAEGMLLNVAAAVDIAGDPMAWSLEGLDAKGGAV